MPKASTPLRLFVVVTHSVNPWGAALVADSEPYALVVVVEEQGRESVRYFTQMQANGMSAITTLALTRSGSQLVLADGINSRLTLHTLSAAGVPNTGNGSSFPSVGRATGMVIAE